MNSAIVDWLGGVSMYSVFRQNGKWRNEKDRDDMCEYTHEKLCSSFYWEKETGSSNNLTVMRAPSTQVWFYRNPVSFKKKKKKSDSTAGAGKVQDEPRIYHPLCQKVKKCTKNDRDTSKGHRSQTEGAPTGQLGQFEY